MTGRLRYLLAAAFVALFWLFPAADPERIAFLKTRAWLIDELSSLTDADQDGPFAVPPGSADTAPAPPLPGMQVDFRQVGKDEQVARSLAPEYARTLREWARANGRAVDPTLPPLLLEVRIGDNGFRSKLWQAPGGAWTGERPPLELQRQPITAEAAPGYYPDRWSLLPAFLAIILAILSGRVIPSLFLGCLAGAVLYARWNVFGGTEHLLVETIWADVLTSQFQLEIMGFVIFLFMCVGVMTRSGGIQGMVEWVRRYARGPVSTQVCAYLIGILIFFDDYSNCIIAGTTMRPLADRNRVSREKLSYIVDSTAAPIAGISIFSTWIAYEVSMFAPQLPEVTRADGTQYTQSDGFAVFVETLPFRFYCIFTLVMVLATIVMRREFGPMLTAARRAELEGKPIADDAHPMVSAGLTATEPREGVPLRGRNALLPIGLLVAMTVALIFWFGSSALAPDDWHKEWWEVVTAILGNGQSQRALFLSAIAAFVLAVALAVGQHILSVKESMMSALRSAHSLLFAVIILILAWTIGQICKDLGTAQYLTAATQGGFSPWLLPVILFLLSSLVSFSTGTSYGTMAILLPNVVVLAHTMGQQMPELGGTGLMILTIGAVLEGSIFGDHCSPISDTTVLSSVATASDHLHHVRTQAPYAVYVMVTATLCGYLPMALLGLSYWPLSWLLGIAVILGGLRLVGRNPAEPDPRARSAPP